MKLVIFIVFSIFLIEFAQGFKVKPYTFGVCKKEQSKNCKFDYVHVCAYSENEIKNFKNACEACKDQQFYGYTYGQCGEKQITAFKNRKHEVVIGECDHHKRPQICTEEFMLPGICGYFYDKNKEGQIYNLYGTPCQACGDRRVKFWVRGECGKPYFAQ